MFYIIEKEEQLQHIPPFDKCFIHVITNNNNYHPAIASISLIYVKPFNSKGYIFCINHTESLSLKWQPIKKFLSEKELYAIDSKHTKYFLSGKINDTTLNHISQGGTKFDFSRCEPIIISNFYRSYGTLKNINELIPISKHYEYCENIYDIVKPYLTKNTDSIYKTIDVFFKIEKEGIKLNKNCFIEYYKEHSTPHFSVRQGRIYTSYNLFTLTGRPSNAFNNINFAALNKENGERECFIPHNDLFIEIDFNGYHPRLLGTLVNYSFDTETNVYQQIGKILNIDDISKAKETTFQNLYGGIRSELQNKPFFKSIQAFTDDLWNTIQYGGYIDTPSGKRFRLKDIENPTPQKVLNYYIQNFETSQNVLQLYALFNDFRPLKSRIVLYTYDSVLIDVVREETQKINEIIAKLQYPVRIKTGNNYNNLN
jgi:hypothetical protein